MKTKKTIGKKPSIKQFGTDCKGCKSKLNTFFRFCLPNEFMSWDCINCGSEFNFYCKTEEKPTEIKNHEIDYIVKAFFTRNGITNNKIYGLIDNENFKELKEEERGLKE